MKVVKPTKIKEKPTYKEKYEHDKNPFRVPRQYLPKPHGRVHAEGHGEKKRNGR